MEEFWLSWSNETVIVGSGRQVGQGEFIKLNDSVPTSKNFLAVSTGFGASGYWIFHSGKILLHIDVNSRPALTLAKMLELSFIIDPQHEMFNNVACATS